MKARLFIILAAALLVGADKNDELIKQDMEKLEGTWIAESIKINGKETKDENQTTRLVIKFGQVSWTYETRMGNSVKQSTIDFTFKISPMKKPKEINMVPTEGTLKGKKFPSIYEIEGDTLKICRSQPATERPKELASKNGNQWLLVLKRAKP